MSEIRLRGGLRWGTVNVTWPFVVAQLTSQRLSFTTFGKVKSFAPEEIIAVTLHRSITSGIRIRHQKHGYPETVIFWTWQPKIALEHFQTFINRQLID